MAFGDRINPALMNVDWSPIERGAQATAGMYRSAGESIEGAMNAFADYKKEQTEQKKVIKQSELYIDAAIKLFPEMSSSLQQAKMQINDENNPLQDRFAVAQSVQGLLNMGMEKMKFNHELVERQMGYQAKMAELAKKPLPIQDIYDSAGGIRQMVNQGGSLRPVSEVIQGNVPQLPADMQTEINTTMPSPDDIGNGEELPGRPIEGQIQEILGLTPNGNIKLVDDSGEIETDKMTFTQKLTGDFLAGGQPPEQAAAEAAKILAAIELNKPAKEEKIQLGVKPADPKKAPAVEMTPEQVDALTSKGMRVSAIPTNKGTFMVSETTSTPETKGQEYTEPYEDPKTGQLVQRRGDGKITVLRETTDQRMRSVLQEAKQKYLAGDDQSALDLLASVRIKGMFGGYPTREDLAEYFGPRQDNNVQPDAIAAPAQKPSLLDRIKAQQPGQ